MSEQHFHYITEPLKGFIFILSADSGLCNIFVRDKINDVNLEINFMHGNTTISLVLLHGRPIDIH